jgi:ferredoxin
MIPLTIDNQAVKVPQGATLLDAADALGIAIPTLCFLRGFEPSTSCMVCVVRVEGVQSLVPACGTLAQPQMHVTTDSAEIRTARKTALELLLGDHSGDCIAPCRIGCPAGMDIPQMLRHIAAGNDRAAIAVVKRDIPLPAVLGRICPAPCEKVCHRGKIDQPVAICRLKRYAADVDLFSGEPFTPSGRDNTGKTVAIVGAGPCGLSAAYYLAQNGVSCVIFDANEQPGGALRYAEIDRTVLPIDIVDKEAQQILKHNIILKPRCRVGQDVAFETLCGQYDAVLIAAGDPVRYNHSGLWGITHTDGRIAVGKTDYLTSRAGVFAAGGAIGRRRLCVRAVADGKEAASAITAYVSGTALADERIFNCRRGQPPPCENSLPRTEPVLPQEGYTSDAAGRQASRCLHCDCRKPDDCRLRQLAGRLGAKQNAWPGEKRKTRLQYGTNGIVYEAGKCIQCGLCIQTAQRNDEPLGLTFAKRGFEMEVAVPFEKQIAAA